MTGLTPALTEAAITHTRTGEAVTFYVLAPIAVGSALAMVFAKNAVHAALMLVIDLFCLAVFYAMQDAPFLAAVQVIVYAGAIMILFLFVLMLVGVDSADSLLETIRGHRIASFLLGLGFLGLLVGVLLTAIEHTSAVGLTQANSGGNVAAIAKLLFTTYVFPFEITSALLIVAAVGAMVLGHRELTEPRPSQADLMRRRLHGPFPEGEPGPGAYATGDSADLPALLPSGAPAPGSVPEEYRIGSQPPATGEERA